MLDGNCHSKRSKKAQWQEALIQRSARVKRSDGASQSTCRVVKSPFEPELYLDRDSLPSVVCYPKNAFHLLLECRSFLLSKKVIMILVFWSQPKYEMFLGTFGSLAKACRQIQNVTKNYIFQCNPLKWLRSIQWLLTPHWINLKRWCGGQQIFNGLCTVCCDSRIHFQEAPTIIIIHFSNGNTYPYFVHLTTSDVFSFNAIMRWVIWIKKWYIQCIHSVFIILC